jgi:hypothetical protein
MTTLYRNVGAARRATLSASRIGARDPRRAVAHGHAQTQGTPPPLELLSIEFIHDD